MWIPKFALALTACVPLSVSGETYGPVIPGTDEVIVAPPSIPIPLTRATALALSNAPKMKAAAADVRADLAAYRDARWLRYPSLSVEALAATRGSSFADRDGITANILLEQSVWSGGLISGQIDRSRAAYRQSSHEKDAVAIQLALRVVDVYYRLAFLEDKVAIYEQGRVGQIEMRDSSRRRSDQGIAPQVDFTLAESRLLQVDAELAEARAAMQDARGELSQLVGEEEISPEVPPYDFTSTLPSESAAIREALECAPELAALSEGANIVLADVRIARGRNTPQLNFQLSQNEITGARAAIVVRAQTGNGLSLLSRGEAERSRYDAAIARLAAAEGDLERQIKEEFNRLSSSREQITVLEQSVDAGQAIAESYQRQFVIGRRSWLEVQNAVRELTSARVAARQARISLATSTARILVLSCRWPVAGDAQ